MVQIRRKGAHGRDSEKRHPLAEFGQKAPIAEFGERHPWRNSDKTAPMASRTRRSWQNSEKTAVMGRIRRTRRQWQNSENTVLKGRIRKKRCPWAEFREKAPIADFGEKAPMAELGENGANGHKSENTALMGRIWRTRRSWVASEEYGRVRRKPVTNRIRTKMAQGRNSDKTAYEKNGRKWRTSTHKTAYIRQNGKETAHDKSRAKRRPRQNSVKTTYHTVPGKTLFAQNSAHARVRTERHAEYFGTKPRT